MRYLIFLVLAVCSTYSAEKTRPFSYWKGEPIEEYAQEVGLPANEVLSLGNDVTMDVVLIPAGKGLLGDARANENQAERDLEATTTSLGIVAALWCMLLAAIWVRSVKRKRTLQFSLNELLLITLGAGVVFFFAFRWWDACTQHQKTDVDIGYADLPRRSTEVCEVKKPFYIGKFEVTEEQFFALIQVNRARRLGSHIPVQGMGFSYAREFCDLLGRQLGRIVRIPTEREWEYACRAGTETNYHSGDTVSDLDRAAWYSGNSQGALHNVGQKAPNAWGIFDMHGNVSELCEMEGEGLWVTRGGSLHSDPIACRSAWRVWTYSGGESAVGFRVVVELPASPADNKEARSQTHRP